MKKIFAGIIAALLATAVHAQNPGTVTNHAYAIGKGPGVSGYTSLLCASGQLALGSATDPTCRTMSGDATLSATGVFTLATVNANIGTFGSATQTPQVTVNGKGLITAATSLTMTPAIGSITGLGAGCATWLGTPSSANLRGCVTDETGTGLAYFQGGDIGTPSAGVGSNLSALNASSLTLGTVATARGGAGTINGVLSGNGSGVVAQGATTGLSDVTTGGAWTPADGSGAALTFTSVTSKYTKIGNMIFAYATLTYPLTASGSNAVISGLPISVPNQTYAQQCLLTYSNVAVAVHLLPNVNASTIGIYNSTGAPITNTAMSTGTIFFECIYPAT